MKHTNKAATCLLAVVLMTMVTALTANAATTALNAQLVLRPFTPGDVSVYKLPSTTEASPGLTTVGIGSPVYLELDINSGIAPSSIVSVTWVLTNVPALSAAVLANSPLGTNVPVYDVSARASTQVASRRLLRPDLEGRYTVIATIVTASNGSTNVTRTITAATYVGLDYCTLCHSGGIRAPDKYTTWQNTAHAHIFTEGINGELGTYRSSCFPCHTVGYNANTNAIVNPVNGGFDDVAKQQNWFNWFTNLPVLANTNWAYMQAVYPDVANLANIQCENCHGPGSQHTFSAGNTNYISKSVNSGDCNQCHDAPTHHIFGTQWYASRHALTTGPSGANCVGCHSANGFIARMKGQTFTNQTMAAIACQACHEPHGETVPTNNPHLLRALGAVTMPDGTVVTNAGNGAICLQCHQNRNGSATNQLVKYPLGQPTWYGGSSFGAHDNPQGDMVEGVNAHTYGQTIPSSAHRVAVPDLCVGCHMQEAPNGDPAYLQAGGHTWNMTYNVVTTNGSTLMTNSYDKVDACTQCHGQIASFNIPRGDLNGDGVIEGVQTEVQHLLDTLSTLLPNSSLVVDGLVKSSLSFKTNWTQAQLKAGYNWQFVRRDGSLGVHNAPFAVGLLKASIADMTGNPTSSGYVSASDLDLYKWQCQYFGSATNPNAAPNATPAGDGIPNWLKYSLGLNPLIPGVAVPGGVVWADGNKLGGSAPTNTVQIYTAAEVTFDTQVGTTYQVQENTSLQNGWQNVGAAIPGTGNAVSYVTPTRKNVQQYFRVVHTP